MNSNKILILLILAGAGWFYFDQRQRQREAELEILRQRYERQNPPEGSPEYLYWIQLALATYGQIKALWEPGGPFYKSNVPNPEQDPDKWAEILNNLSHTDFFP